MTKPITHNMRSLYGLTFELVAAEPVKREVVENPVCEVAGSCLYDLHALDGDVGHVSHQP